jgi:paraquat-inducible protein B
MDRKRRISGKDYYDFYAEQISRGLAAKLSLESVVTGKSFVALDYYPQDNERYFRDIDKLKYQQMPSMRTDLDEFIASVDSAVKNLSQIDFAELSESLKKTLIKFRRAIDDADLIHMSKSFSESCNSVSKLINSEGVKNITNGIETAVKKFNFKFDGMADNFSETFESIRSLISGDSPFRWHLENSLLQLERMLCSLREFLDFLERNPNAIFAGKCL